MKELNSNELQSVNGGLPLVVAIPAAFLIRKYGTKAAVAAAGVVVGWLSE